MRYHTNPDAPHVSWRQPQGATISRKDNPRGAAISTRDTPGVPQSPRGTNHRGARNVSWGQPLVGRPRGGHQNCRPLLALRQNQLIVTQRNPHHPAHVKNNFHNFSFVTCTTRANIARLLLVSTIMIVVETLKLHLVKIGTVMVVPTINWLSSQRNSATSLRM